MCQYDDLHQQVQQDPALSSEVREELLAHIWTERAAREAPASTPEPPLSASVVEKLRQRLDRTPATPPEP